MLCKCTYPYCMAQCIYCPNPTNSAGGQSMTRKSSAAGGSGGLDDNDSCVQVAALVTGGKGWCPGPVHHKYITRKWTKYQANTHPAHPKFIQNFPSQFSCNFPSTGNGQYIHSVPDHVTGISPLGKSWECSKFSQRM